MQIRRRDSAQQEVFGPRLELDWIYRAIKRTRLPRNTLLKNLDLFMYNGHVTHIGSHQREMIPLWETECWTSVVPTRMQSAMMQAKTCKTRGIVQNCFAEQITFATARRRETESQTRTKFDILGALIELVRRDHRNSEVMRR